MDKKRIAINAADSICSADQKKWPDIYQGAYKALSDVEKLYREMKAINQHLNSGYPSEDIVRAIELAVKRALDGE